MPQLEPRGSIRASDRAAFVEGTDYAVTSSGCWEWLGRRDEKGYGLGCKTAGEYRVHRASWAVVNGPIPPGSHIHHKCENPPCMRPDHLERKTHSKHLADHHQADSVLTWNDVREMRRLWATGEWTSGLLGARFGVETSMAWRIVDNRNWVDAEYTPPVWERVCPLRECGATFATKKPHKRFCCGKHRNIFNNRTPGGYVDRRLDREAA